LLTGLAAAAVVAAAHWNQMSRSLQQKSVSAAAAAAAASAESGAEGLSSEVDVGDGPVPGAAVAGRGTDAVKAAWEAEEELLLMPCCSS
jgi:hypothetical protein